MENQLFWQFVFLLGMASFFAFLISFTKKINWIALVIFLVVLFIVYNKFGRQEIIGVEKKEVDIPMRQTSPPACDKRNAKSCYIDKDGVTVRSYNTPPQTR